MLGATFQEGLPRSELPAAKAFGQHKLQESAQDHCPQDGNAEMSASEACGRQIARTDARSGNEQAG
ncbi:MAG: hypothetical protein AMXMBFR82_08990 [Candidatus Hydrogenedentota bacterium]